MTQETAATAPLPVEAAASATSTMPSEPSGQPFASAVRFVQQAGIAAMVTMLAIGAYDTLVRQPRTPRLAVVDVARLYEMAHQRAARQALSAADAARQPSAAASSSSAAALAGEALARLYRTPEEFGPALSGVMKGLADDCRCTLVAMASVFGADATVPDYTDAAAALLGMEVEARDVSGEEGSRR
jgi:hypothetical protein